MKEIVMISGKGGTGKTSLTAAFAILGGKDVVVADCDVDAADMHLLMKPDYAHSEDFHSGYLAVIDPFQCTGCGDCMRICRFNAVEVRNRIYKVDPLRCEGCGYCARICPANAIKNKEKRAGQWYISGIRTGSSMVHARLAIGADHSGKLVARVKNEAKDLAFEERCPYVLVDGSPGIGCPVISSLSGANLAVLVTEPTISGLHDLKRVYALVKKFGIRAGCIINKADINAEMQRQIRHFLLDEKIFHLGDLPYDEAFTNSMVAGNTILESNNETIIQLITSIWDKIKSLTS